MRPLLRRLLDTPAYVWAALLLTALLLFLAQITRLQGVEGAVVVRDAQVRLAGDPLAQERPVALPHVWDDRHRSWSGEAWYRIGLPAELEPQAMQEPGIGLLLPRVGVRFRVLFNGHELASEGWRRGAGYMDAGVQAQYVPLPASLMRRPWGDNKVEVQLRGQALRISGLSPVWFGPSEALQQRHRWLMWWQVHLTWMVAASGFLLGLLSLLIWAHSGERLFGLLAGGLLVLTLRLTLSAPVFLPGTFGLWDYLHKLAFTFYCGLICPRAARHVRSRGPGRAAPPACRARAAPPTRRAPRPPAPRRRAPGGRARRAA